MPGMTSAHAPLLDTAPLLKNGWMRRVRGWRWVPIRVLQPRHRARLEAHLLSLSERDRFLRFGYAASDERIREYVAALDFSRDQIHGIFNRHLKLVATAHLAIIDTGQGELLAEFAVSVLTQTRGRHYGSRLFAHAVTQARNRGIRRMFIHALTENTAMLRIARNAGAKVEQEGSESEAWLQLPPDHLGTHVEALVSHQAAELNYGFKRQGRRFGTVLDIIDELRKRMANRRLIARE